MRRRDFPAAAYEDIKVAPFLNAFQNAKQQFNAVMHAKKFRRKNFRRKLSKFHKRLLFIALPIFVALALIPLLALLICGAGKLYPDEFLDNVLGPASAVSVLVIMLIFAAVAVLMKLAQASDDAKNYNLAKYDAGDKEEYDNVTTLYCYYSPDLFESDGTVTLKGIESFMTFLENMTPRYLGEEDMPEELYPPEFEPVDILPEIAENLEFELTKRTDGDILELTVAAGCKICFGADGLHIGEKVLEYEKMFASCEIFFTWRTYAMLVLFYKTSEDNPPIAKFRLDGRILAIFRKYNITIVNEKLVLQAESNLKKTFRSQALKFRQF